MITQVDAALCRLIRPHLPEGTEIRLDPPKPAWQSENRVRSVELFLFALHAAAAEETPARGVARDGGRNAGAGGTGVTRPARRCTLSYLVTARAGRVHEEHTLLDAALYAVVESGLLPADVEEGGLPVSLSLAGTDPTGLWPSLGIPARAGFVVSVTAGVTAPKR
ncbi:Pvc16 family protein [Amycolatopsis sp. NPDC059021]|uniref:Pvc16 family protein n=1 Tax=Amycolatopsis sp. NPDC059021 TaxID=3346704 RepID=UPI00366BBB92